LSEPRTLAPPERRVAVVSGIERLGAYHLVTAHDASGPRDPRPGQFYMLASQECWGGADDERPYLPRAFSYARAHVEPDGVSLGFLLEAIGPGTRALAAVERDERIRVFGPLGNGYRLDVPRPLLVGGGIGIAPLPYLSEKLGGPPALVGFRSDRHAEAATLVPNAEVVVEPTFVTEPLAPLAGDHDVLACGPEPMLEAVRALAPRAQLAWEAPMACGYGACYGCSVEIDGVLKRLCVEGPVLQNGGTQGSPVSPLLHTSHEPASTRAPDGQSPAPPRNGSTRSNSRTKGRLP
jgi:dihydroorotate dehydrogenase electron transfer subunit